MQSNTMTVDEYRNSEAYRDIQSTAVMYMLSKDAALNNFVEHSINLQQTINKQQGKIQSMLEDKVSDLKQETWLPVEYVATQKKLTADGVRKQLQNGEFEDGVDFKKPNGKILIHQRAVERIRRRRSSNG